MIKGLRNDSAPQQVSDASAAAATDADASHIPTHSLEELEYLECDSPRYTVGQLGSRLLCMAYLDEDNPGVLIDLCTACMQMAVGEKPCPHGSFPHDRRERPLILWRKDLESLVRDVLAEFVANPASAPPSLSVGGGVRDFCSYDTNAQHGICRICFMNASMVSSVSSITAPTTGTAVGEDASTVNDPSVTIVAPSDYTDIGNGSQSTQPYLSTAGIRDLANGAPGSGVLDHKDALSIWEAVHDALINVIRPPPAADPPVPADPAVPPTGPPVAPSYVAHIDKYVSSNHNWHVVYVGRTVGVFRDWSSTKDSTHGVSGNVHESFRSYQDAVQAFNDAELRGCVSQRM